MITIQSICSLPGGGNGKSKYFNIINAIVGSSCMNISLKELTKERFAPANLCDKTCNISPDETNLEILDTGTLKRLSGGDNISADKKFAVDMVSFKSVVKLLISMNEELSFADNTKGFSRRVRVIPFKGTFETGNRDVHIERRLLSKEVLQIIAYKAMVAFKARLDGGYDDLTYPSSVKNATDKYLAKNDPIGEFVKWYMDYYYHSTCLLATELYDKFVNWCKSSCLSGLKISDDKLRTALEHRGFVFDVGEEAGTEDVYVYTPDYVKDNFNLSPNIKFYDCSNCAYCGSSMECMRCIKRDLFDTKDTTLNVPELLQMFYDNLPDEVKDKLSVPKSGALIEGLEDFE